MNDSESGVGRMLHFGRSELLDWKRRAANPQLMSVRESESSPEGKVLGVGAVLEFLLKD